MDLNELSVKLDESCADAQMADAATPAATEGPSAELLAQIEAQGKVVRDLKESGAGSDDVKAAVAKLLELKAAAGMAPAKKEKKKKAAPAPAAEGGEKKLSKKQQKRMKNGKVDKPKKEKPQWGNAKPKEIKQIETFDFVNTTPKGQKKDMTATMEAAYHPIAVESAWNDWWEASGFYSVDAAAAADAKEEDKFVMVIPPPNVTGSLHLGHALTCSIEDALTRWHRMSGRHTLWLPGTDHAGIATQVVVEKKLMRERGISRHVLGREDFLKEVWAWKEANGNRITQQLRRLGASVDWSREVFTMDDTRGKAVTEAFVRMYESGLIYRSTRLVNWCCTLKTAISDIEVEHVDVEKRTLLAVPGYDKKHEFGVIISFAYKVEGSDTDEIVVATTRLETMLGDTAVAVHPQDPRYAHLHGKCVVHPFSGRAIPIVLDDVLVDMAFGTGAVKITPAHDPNDFACGRRHRLPEINIFTEDGLINANGAQFEGMKRFDARVAVQAALEELGLYRGKADNKMRVPLCSRSKDVIEPMLKPQWYVNCNDMAARAVQVVRSGELKIVPSFHEDTWYRWLENIRDWCISRQLWWGHRIPAYFAYVQGEALPDRNSSDSWVVGRTREDALAAAAQKLGVPPEAVVLEQDEDVLDTWFSSGLFPFSVMGWPDNDSLDLKSFFPGQLLETGHDILFFWVARMVMMSLQLTDQLPFKTVYLHAMVRDKYGRKMSKSLGNVVDPLEVIDGCPLDVLIAALRNGNLDPREVEKAVKGKKMDFPNGIPECGADALRFGLLAYTIQGRDVNLDINRVVGYRQFCNKLWNLVRFMLMHLDDFQPCADMISQATAGDLATRDRWILSRLNACVQEVGANMEAYLFGTCCSAIYRFFLYELCDVYVESVKPVMAAGSAEGADAAAVTARQLTQRTLWLCLDVGLRLLHPLMPYVTEELWQRLPGRQQAGCVESIMIAPYPAPVPALADEQAEQMVARAQQACHACRSLKSEYNLKSGTAQYWLKATSAEDAVALSQQLDDIVCLSTAKTVQLLQEGEEAPEGCGIMVVDESLQVLVLLKGLIDVDSEVRKLDKKLKQLEFTTTSLKKKMAAPQYSERVPPEVQEANVAKLAAQEQEMDSICAAKEKLLLLA